MKLSRLVSYLNHLDALDIHAASTAVGAVLDPVVHYVSQHELQFDQRSDKLNSMSGAVQTLIRDFQQEVSALRSQIQANVEHLEPHYLSESYKLYSENMRNDSVDLMLNRRFNLASDVAAYIRARILRYGDWHFPGMIVRPGLEPWIQDLVALDPLYLVDIDHDMLRPVIQTFPQEYQNRLRCHIIREYTDTVSLAGLPQQQMAFVLVYNYFNYKPLEMIRTMLSEIWNCLRPGGVVAFTFNNCDRAGGVDLAERYFMCYTPGRLVLSAATMLGYDVVHTYDIDAATTWAELRRPGQLQSLRGGQALAKIRSKPIERILDSQRNRVYTAQELEALRSRACGLGLTHLTTINQKQALELIDLILQGNHK